MGTGRGDMADFENRRAEWALSRRPRDVQGPEPELPMGAVQEVLGGICLCA